MKQQTSIKRENKMKMWTVYLNMDEKNDKTTADIKLSETLTWKFRSVKLKSCSIAFEKAQYE